MILAFDTSTAACTAALFDGSGSCVARADEQIGRGHAERVMPMIDELLAGRRAEKIIVGVGPGSFTGIRVAIAAAHGLAIGWGAELTGMSSLALLAASSPIREGEVGAAVIGGHGELFVQEFDAGTLEPITDLRNLRPAAAAAEINAAVVIGSGARHLVDCRGAGTAVDAWPSASNALRLPVNQRTLPPRPVYARAPDARAKEAA